ncbi:MAG TPA: diacylglycerol kinase family protein [Acidimicrobiales bacterium]|nr:diacylglycerol kinase family protein [Acidimicrobiales bacterium]
MRLLLLVNTSASSVTPRARVVIHKALAADHDVHVAETSRRGHAMRLALGAATDGVDVVVVLGGDGTLNEAANGLAGTGTALAVVPGGSTNVFARTIGLVNDPIEATGQLLAALNGPAPARRIGLGSMNGRYFLFNAGVGLDAAVIARVDRRRALKRWAAHPLFVWSAVSTWARHYDRRRPSVRVEFPGADGIDGYFVLVLNSDPYTFLGARPLHLVPEATLDRAVAVVTFRTLAPLPFARTVVSALGVGRRAEALRSVDVRTDLDAFGVRALHAPLPVQVDGEYLGEVEHAAFRYEPDVLSVVFPGT